MADIKMSDLTITNPQVGDLWINDTTDSKLYFNGTCWEDVQAEQDTRMDRLERMVDKIADRLAVLDDPDPEKLAQFETLREAYNKYKFVDTLCGEKKDG